MAYKTFELDGIGTVHVYKRRGTTSIRLTIGHEGKVRVTIPFWVSYRAAVAFARDRQAWITLHSKANAPLQPNQRIGKHHTLYFRNEVGGQKIRTRVNNNGTFVYLPLNVEPSAEAAQKAANQAAQKALRQEAENLLPQRLAELAKQHDFTYQSVSIRALKSRWGSCDTKHHITLNYFLMQLPWSLIDYVLIHELAHTKHLNHSTAFWETVERIIPHYKQRRKALKDYQPSVITNPL